MVINRLIALFIVLFVFGSISCFSQNNIESSKNNKILPVKLTTENKEITAITAIQDTTKKPVESNDLKDYSQKYMPEEQKRTSNPRYKKVEKIYLEPKSNNTNK